MALKHLDFHDRVGMLCAAQELVDAYRGALAIGHAINNEARTEDAVAAGKYAGRQKSSVFAD